MNIEPGQIVVVYCENNNDKSGCRVGEVIEYIKTKSNLPDEIMINSIFSSTKLSNGTIKTNSYNSTYRYSVDEVIHKPHIIEVAKDRKRAIKDIEKYTEELSFAMSDIVDNTK